MFSFNGNNFKPNTPEENAQALADLCPQGFAWDAKNVPESNFRKLLLGLAKQHTRTQDKIYELSIEYFPDTTTNLIERWERALGIPDDCFSNLADLPTRRKQCVAKLAKMNVQTRQDFIGLADYFGYRVAIRSGEVGASFSTFPLVFPAIFGSKKVLSHTMVVTFLDLDKPANIFTMTFPFELGENSNIIRCLFNKLRPANVQVLYEYKT